MTEGEKMIWAAAFIRSFRDGIAYLNSSPMPNLTNDFYEGFTHSAAEVAAGAVRYLRDYKAGIIEGFGEDSEVSQMLKEMLGDENGPRTEKE